MYFIFILWGTTKTRTKTKWLHANGCPWDEWTCTKAGEAGHLDVLQWLACLVSMTNTGSTKCVINGDFAQLVPTGWSSGGCGRNTYDGTPVCSFG
jgi:hypothetical protein